MPALLGRLVRGMVGTFGQRALAGATVGMPVPAGGWLCLGLLLDLAQHLR